MNTMAVMATHLLAEENEEGDDEAEWADVPEDTSGLPLALLLPDPAPEVLNDRALRRTGLIPPLLFMLLTGCHAPTCLSALA